MKAKTFKRILSVVLSLQMVCTVIPSVSLNAKAEELQMYLNEDFTSEITSGRAKQEIWKS